MKKCFFFFILVITFFVCACSNKNIGLIEIDFDTLNKMVENKKTFMLEVMQDGCSACEDFTPRFIKILNEYELKAYSINLSKLSNSEKDAFDEIANISGTPNVIFLEDGKEQSLLTRISGSISNERIIRKLKSNGYIN